MATDVLMQNTYGAMPASSKTVLLNRAKDHAADCTVVGLVYNSTSSAQSYMVRHLIDLCADRCAELIMAPPIAIIMNPLVINEGSMDGIEAFRLSDDILTRVLEAKCDAKRLKVEKDELALIPVELQLTKDVSTKRVLGLMIRL